MRNEDDEKDKDKDKDDKDDKDKDVWGRMMSQTVGIGQLIAERRSMGLGEPKFTLFSCGRKTTRTTGRGHGETTTSGSGSEAGGADTSISSRSR